VASAGPYASLHLASDFIIIIIKDIYIAQVRKGHKCAINQKNHLSLWRMASAMPDLRLPSRPQGITAPWPVPSYTGWWQRHMCVNNLPKLLPESGMAGSQTRDILCREPTP